MHAHHQMNYEMSNVSLQWYLLISHFGSKFLYLPLKLVLSRINILMILLFDDAVHLAINCRITDRKQL